MQPTNVIRGYSQAGVEYNTSKARYLAGDGQRLCLYRRDPLAPYPFAPAYFSVTLRDDGRNGAVTILDEATARALYELLPEKQVTVATAFSTT